MKLPKQLPAVERKVNKHAAVPIGANVRPAFLNWDISDFPNFPTIARLPALGGLSSS